MCCRYVLCRLVGEKRVCLKSLGGLGFDMPDVIHILLVYMCCNVRVGEKRVRLDLRMVFILSIAGRGTNREKKNQGLGKMPFVNKI